MVMRVQRIGDEYGVIFSREVLETLHLVDGAEVEVRSASREPNPPAESRLISTEEALASFRKTLPQHRDAYIELAK